MKFRVLVRAAAEHDAAEAQDWCDRQTLGLALRFTDEFITVLDAIARSPLVHREVYQDVRRAVLPKFPYQLWFLVDEESRTVHVLACTHEKRDPRRVESRLSRSPDA